MKLYNVCLAFKAERTYIQGPDLFSEMCCHLNEKKLEKINFSIHRVIKNNEGKLYITDDFHQFKMLPVSFNASACVTARDKQYWIAFFFSEDIPVKPLRKSYDENTLTRLCHIDKETIRLEEKSPFLFVETIVSMYKKLLQTLYPNRGKWLFTKLVLTSYIIESPEVIFITLSQNFNFKLIKANIFVDHRFVGELYFSLMPENKNDLP
ncbi:MAG: hypothetical protein A3F18_04075 [Legionellales bacterium RIFCSPHIGHO2_12_FULL_37_14]|nr:MAG: hypothetical protein A3F18_04075 [Legionellales bacterium RIFCSPHIGHO2_12_FULL_37_14]